MEYKKGLFGVLNPAGFEKQPLVLLDGGIERRFHEDYYFNNEKRHGYCGYLFQYTLSGCGCFEREGRFYSVGEGEGFFVGFPDNSRYSIQENGDDAWEFLYLHFDGPAAEAFAGKIKELYPAVFSLGKASLPIRMALELQERLTQGGRLQKYEGGEFLYQFLCALLREAERPQTAAGGSIVDCAAAIMKEEYFSLQSLEELAARLHVSPEHLSRTFTSEMGVNPNAYLTELRLQSALNDLLDSEEGVAAIAEKNGFTSGNYFIKVFRKHVGISPGRYRKERKERLCKRR